jgi:hypothetical protein
MQEKSLPGWAKSPYNKNKLGDIDKRNEPTKDSKPRPVDRLHPPDISNTYDRVSRKKSRSIFSTTWPISRIMTVRLTLTTSAQSLKSLPNLSLKTSNKNLSSGRVQPGVFIEREKLYLNGKYPRRNAY